MNDHFFVKFSKCLFCQTQIEYLGHIVSTGIVKADTSKLEAMQSWPLPCCLKHLSGFLGLTGYYRRFIRHYAMIAAPLIDFLRKDAFHWTPETTKAFDSLKATMFTAPVLGLSDFSKPFEVETDASGTGIGAILLQDGHPIAYFSKKICPRLQYSSAYIRELHALTEAILK